MLDELRQKINEQNEEEETQKAEYIGAETGKKPLSSENTVFE